MSEPDGHHGITRDDSQRLVEMAAVLGEFDPLALLTVAFGQIDLPEKVLDGLLDDLARASSEVHAPEGVRWKLREDARRAAIAALGRSGRLEAVIAMTPPAEHDGFGRQLQTVLRRDRNVRLADLSREDLHALALALDFARYSLDVSWRDFLPEDPRAVLSRILLADSPR